MLNFQNRAGCVPPYQARQLATVSGNMIEFEIVHFSGYAAFVGQLPALEAFVGGPLGYMSTPSARGDQALQELVDAGIPSVIASLPRYTRLMRPGLFGSASSVANRHGRWKFRNVGQDFVMRVDAQAAMLFHETTFEPRTMTTPTAQRVHKHRLALRAAGLRPVQIWVPDTRRADFAAQCRRQSQSLADSPDEKALQEWLEQVADTDGWR